METGRIWELLESSGGSAEKLTEKLAKLTPQEIIEFDKGYTSLHNQLHQWRIWGAAYVMNGGCGDDSFDYFKSWVIGKGKRAFETALSDPDALGEFATEADAEEGFNGEMLDYSALEAYEEAGGDEADWDNDPSERGEPAGEPFEESELAKDYPRLWSKYGN